jgi:hypothetical protein
MTMKIKVKRKVDIAPGIVSYELDVSDGLKPVRKPKIDKVFAQAFAERMMKTSKLVK